MVVRMGMTLALSAASAMVAAGLGVVVPPAAHAADPVLPGPTSSSWLAVKKGGNVATDAANDFTTAHLNLTPSGGTLGPATVFASADLQYAYFRFHVAGQPDTAPGNGYVVQFDTDGSTAGWERALRFEPAARAVEIYTSDANSAPKAVGTLANTVALPASGAATYPGADGGVFVAFALSRAALANAGINLGAPMVMGATSEDGAGLDTGGLLGIGAKADILGVGKGATSWQSAATDPLDIDSDGDGFADRIDNCPIIPNADQADDDKDVDNSLPPGTIGVPDGTEGRGNLCDRTPRGYDLDEDEVGSMDDQCPERPGLLANGCVAQSTTTALLRYNAKRKRFSGTVRADYDECVPRRTVTVFRSVAGPDRQLGTVKTDGSGSYALAKRAKRGKYYVQVDTKLLFDVGARCFGVKSPRIQVR